MANLGREDISSTGRTYGEELRGPLKKDTEFLKEYAEHLAEINDLYDEQASLLEEQILRSLSGIDEFIDEELKKLDSTGRSIRDIRDLVSDMLDDLRGTGKIIAEREKSIRNFRDLSAEIEQSLKIEGGAHLKSLESLVKKAEKQKELNRYITSSLGTIAQQKKAIFELEDKQLDARKTLRSLESQYSQRNLTPAQRSNLFDQIRDQKTLLNNLEKELLLRKRNIDLIDLENRGISDQLIQQARVNLETNREIRSETGILGGFSKILEKIGFAGAGAVYEDYVQAATRVRSLGKERSGLEAELSGLKGKRGKTAKSQRDQIKARLTTLGIEEVEAQEALTAAGGGTVGVLKEMLKTGLANLSVAGLALGFVRGIWKAFKDVTEEAAKLKQQIGTYNVDLAAANFQFATATDWLRTANDLASKFHINPVEIFTKDEIGAMAEAKNLLGYSSEQVNNLGMRMKLAGMSARDYEQSLIAGADAGNRANKTAFAAGDVAKQILSTSDEIVLSLGNSGEALGKATVAANALGMSLKDVDSIAGQLMNFESSIENEMKAQLLTGNQLNLSKARGLALQNDLEGVAKELARQNIDAAKFASWNRIQQESTAAALGMSREQLGQMLVSQANLTDLSEEQVRNATGLSIEQYKAMGVSSTWQKTLEKFMQAWTPLLMPVFAALTKIAEALTWISGAIGWITSGFGLFSKAAAKSGEEVGSTIQKNQASLGGLIGSFVALGVVGPRVLALIGGGLGRLLGGISGRIGRALGAVGRGLTALLRPLANPQVALGAVVLVAITGAIRLLAGAAEATSRALGNMAAAVQDLSWEQIGQLATLGPTMLLVGTTLAMATPGLAMGSLGLGIFTRRIKKLSEASKGIPALAQGMKTLAEAVGNLKSNITGLDTSKLKDLAKISMRTAAIRGLARITGALSRPEAGGEIAAANIRTQRAALKETQAESQTVVQVNTAKIENLLAAISSRLNEGYDVYLDADKVGRTLAVRTTQG